MARKPVHIERSGGKGPRQKVWEELRRRREGITYASVSRATKVEIAPVSDYMRALSRAGYLELTSPLNAPVGSEKVWTLVRDDGIHAPRVRDDGSPVTQGKANQNLWGTMQRIDNFNARELAALAATDTCSVAEETAKRYIAALHQAGYLQMVEPARPPAGKRPPQQARYTLPPKKRTGRRAPMIQRTRCLYDPNLDRIVWQEEPDRDAC